jgi:protein-ribulosamine 3-kinase
VPSSISSTTLRGEEYKEMSLPDSTLRAIEEAITASIGGDFRAGSVSAVGGGSINQAYCLESGEAPGKRFFLKTNTAGRLAMFEAEAEGLQAIRDSMAIGCPRPIATGADLAHSWLVLEYIEAGRPTDETQEMLGQQLAAMHANLANEGFGWHRDNTIGSTPQVNNRADSWSAFYTEHRLGYQLALAQGNGAPAGLIDRGAYLAEHVPIFFQDYSPKPSLLHGDLWGGNWCAAASGEPVIFDPATYYGDREADLAMTELFGGFGDRFYQSYVSAWAIDPGYETRKVLYNLYHVLNHFNLFGAGYAAQAESMIDALIAEIS